MKKALAILLVLVMAASVFACAGKGTDTPAATATANQPADGGNDAAPPADGGGDTAAPVGDGSSAYPGANADGSINLETIAHYDVNYDYTQNERYKVCYLAQSGGPLYEQSAAAYEHWAPLYNMEWAGYISTNGDSDLYQTTLQNMLDQGIRAFILDPDNTIFNAVVKMIDQYPDAAWMSQMSAPRDGATGDGVAFGGNMMHPYVGFDNYDAGIQVTKKILEWKEETYPDVPWSEVGMLCMQFSTSPPLEERVVATRDLWIQTTGSDANFFTADCVSTGINLQGGIDAVGPVISVNSDIKYWLINGLIDDFAQAAASVIDQQGLTETTCVACFGGSGLQMQWDAGQHDSFRYALFTAQNLYAEPIIGAVYAYLNGWATPQTIWPRWINKHDSGKPGETYPSLRLPTVWLEPDTYKHYLEWTDMYANATAYNYSQDGINLSDYSPFVKDVPPEFA